MADDVIIFDTFDADVDALVPPLRQWPFGELLKLASAGNAEALGLVKAQLAREKRTGIELAMDQPIGDPT